MKVALRCGHGSPQRKSSVSALRSTFASKTVRSPPLCAIEEEHPNLAHPDAPPDRCVAKDFSPSSDTSSAAGEPVGSVTPPQGLTAATPFAQSRDTFVPDGAERLSKQIPPAPPTVLTTPFSVDPLKLPSTQGEEDSPTRIGQEPLATSRNVSRAPTAAIQGEYVPTSGTEIAAPAGTVSSRVPYRENGPSSYQVSEKPPPPHVHAATTLSGRIGQEPRAA